MNFSNYRLSLDIHETESGLSLRAKKGDTIRKIYVTLMDGGVPYRITPDCSAAFTARKPDNTILFNDAVIENNAIVYELTPQTTATAGQVRCEVRLYGGDGRLITSPRFFLDVDDTVFTEGDEVVSEDEYTILEDAIDEVHQAVADAKAEVDQVVEDFQKRVDSGEFTDDVSNSFLHKTGGTMSGDIAMDGHKVTGLGTPTEPGDAVSKSAMEKALEELTGGSIPISVENGGTGATSAADARANLGAVNKAGDTMTGRLILPTLRMNPDSNFPTLEIYSGGSLIATLNWNKNTRRTQIVNYSPNTDYREIFASPAADSDLAEDQYYELLTSKIPVTVAQGGTGASTAAGARENLGVSGALKLTAVWTNSSPESSFAAQTVALSGASGLDMAFWIVEYRGLASDTGSCLNTIAFPGHGTVSHYHNESKIMGRSVEFSGTSAVFKDCYTGTTVDNTCLVPYRIYAVHRA